MNMKVGKPGDSSLISSKVDFNDIKIAKNIKTQKKEPPITPTTNGASEYIVKVNLGNGNVFEVTAGRDSPYRINPSRLSRDFAKAGSNISVAYNQMKGYEAEDHLKAGQRRVLNDKESEGLAKIIWDAIKNRDSSDSLTRAASQKILNECMKDSNIRTAQAALDYYYAAVKNSSYIELASL